MSNETNVVEVVEPVLLFSDARGIYIPRDFTDLVNMCERDGSELTEAHQKNIEELKDVDCPEYWEIWETVLNEVCVYKETNNGQDKEVFFLHQDGNLWAIPKLAYGSMSDEDGEEWWSNHFGA